MPTSDGPDPLISRTESNLGWAGSTDPGSPSRTQSRMTGISWSTIGKDDPLIRGNPGEFDGVASTFDGISERTSSLNDDLREISVCGVDGFSGDAANAFADQIRSISGVLNDVPIVASRISRVFQNHSHDLRALRKEAGAALARAETRWNHKRRAMSDLSSHESRIQSIDRQLSALSGDEDPGAASERARLQSRRSDARHQLGQAERRLSSAEDQLIDSRNEWDRLRRREDGLNEWTSKSLVDLELSSLADPGRLEQYLDKLGDWYKGLGEAIMAIWESISVELLSTLYEILSSIMDVLDWAGLVLDFIPRVNAIYKAVETTVFIAKAIVGLGLVAKGAMSWGAYAAETALDAIGLVPGVPKALIKPSANAAAKALAPAVKGISGGVQQTLKRSGRDPEKVANVVENAAERAAKRIESTGAKLNQKVSGYFDRFNNKGIKNLGGDISKNLEDRSKAVAGGLNELGDLGDDIIGYGVDDLSGTRLYNTGSTLWEAGAALPEPVPIVHWGEEKIVQGADGLDRALREWAEPVKDGCQPVLVPCGL